MTTMSKKAELFDKAIIDLWQAEQTVNFRADATIYNCLQCAEKMMKGVLKCYDQEYEYDHNIEMTFALILKAKEIVLVNDLSKHIQALSYYGNALRYVNRANDPTIENGLKILNLTKELVADLSVLPKVKQYYDEAYQYNKIIFGKAEDLLRKHNIGRIFEEKKKTSLQHKR